jgi:hypothetical protein
MRLCGWIAACVLVGVGVGAGGARARAEAVAAAGAAAAPVVSGAARVFHKPPSSVPAGQPVELEAAIADAWQEPSIEVRYRAVGGSEYDAAPFERSTAGGYRASIPVLALATGALEYYIVGTDRTGKEHAHFATADEPHRVAATPSRDEERAELERRLVGGRLSLFRLKTTVLNFGRTRAGQADYLYRAEADYTYRFLHLLYSVRMGYGLVRSRGPIRIGGTDSVPQFNPTEERDAGVDYGFAEVRFRFDPRVDVDGRLILGATDSQVALGGAGRLRIGREDGAHVGMGFEYIPTLGYNAHLRLQWDTVPHVLMAATLIKTSWPRTDRNGGDGIMLETLLPVGKRYRFGVEVGYVGRRDNRGSVAGSASFSYEY